MAGASAAAVLLFALALAWHGEPVPELAANGEATPPSPLLANAVAEAIPTATGASRLQSEAAPATVLNDSDDSADTGVQLINDEELFALSPAAR